jgi:hypothetical protein
MLFSLCRTIPIEKIKVKIKFDTIIYSEASMIKYCSMACHGMFGIELHR